MKKYELKDILLVRIIHYWRRKRGQLLLCNKHLFCSAGFGEREIRLTARTGEFTRIVERATESSAAQPRAIIF